MATSVIEICNNALIDLGETTIMSLTDDTQTARLCNQRWPAVRDAVLRAPPWNCCMTQAELAAVSGPPVWKWDFQYRVPTDTLRVIEPVSSSETPVDAWEVQGRTIFCNERPPIYIAYVRRETDPQLYDSLLDESLAARLSAVLAYPLTGSTSLAQSFWANYQGKLAEARGVDAREGSPTHLTSHAWLAAKLGRD
jgi:hypothetical protein